MAVFPTFTKHNLRHLNVKYRLVYKSRCQRSLAEKAQICLAGWNGPLAPTAGAVSFEKVPAIGCESRGKAFAFWYISLTGDNLSRT
jgi:hypothetical protein